ncbi:MAG: hybrid sensor histidine kinase/response regulator [Deltaproteobacteria bacterium]|nr:MAG: hybrid sensor histidine kinase/response regulator [Deltaproteobacteria bacterium]
MPGLPKAPVKILYIEDNWENQLLIKTILTKAGYDVLLAGDGLSGIQTAREELPDLILMDINIPGIDGLEATTKIKSLPHLENVPIIAVTAGTVEGGEELAVAAGCEGYITKPIDVARFPLQIAEFLEGKSVSVPPELENVYLKTYSRRLVDRLQQKIEQLTQVNMVLEQRVAERTRDVQEAYKELQQTQQKLVQQEKMAALGEMSAQIAHEIRNQLQKLKSGIQYFQEYSKLSTAEEKVLRGVIHGVDYLERIVTDLLDFSKPEKLNLENVEIHTLLDQILGLFAEEFEKTRITLRKDYLGEEIRMTIDPLKIKHAIKNLIRNAVQAMEEEGGDLIVATRLTTRSLRKARKSDPEDLRKIAIENNFLDIAIGDSGPGMPPEIRSEIFRPFFTTRTKGMGLGLAFTKKMIDYHGGEITVTSEPGNGTCFTISLPLYPG